MKKIKVATIIGTRPEIIRLSETIKELDKHTDHILIHTGQNYDYELNEVFFKDLGLRKPDYFLNSTEGATTASQTIGNVISKVDEVLEKVNPEALLILGDTNSCLSCIPAKRRKIPVFHMEAGNRCFDERVPEEINRRIVDHTSDINLPYSDIAREYLLREGLSPDRVIKTGSPMFEVLQTHLPHIKNTDILNRLDLKAQQYFVVSCHREENVDNEINLRNWHHSIQQIAETYQLPIIISTHPRTQKQIERTGLSFHPLVKLSKPMGFHDYNALQMNAKAVLSDSGTISEESSVLGFPALNIREAHERPEAMEEATVMMVGLKWERVGSALTLLLGQRESDNYKSHSVKDYSIDNVSQKVVRIILSYTDYINRVVWRK